MQPSRLVAVAEQVRRRRSSCHPPPPLGAHPRIPARSMTSQTSGCAAGQRREGRPGRWPPRSRLVTACRGRSVGYGNAPWKRRMASIRSHGSSPGRCAGAREGLPGRRWVSGRRGHRRRLSGTLARAAGRARRDPDGPAPPGPRRLRRAQAQQPVAAPGVGVGESKGLDQLAGAGRALARVAAAGALDGHDGAVGGVAGEGPSGPPNGIGRSPMRTIRGLTLGASSRQDGESSARPSR